jgi:hypothetical protein
VIATSSFSHVVANTGGQRPSLMRRTCTTRFVTRGQHNSSVAHVRYSHASLSHCGSSMPSFWRLPCYAHTKPQPVPCREQTASIHLLLVLSTQLLVLSPAHGNPDLQGPPAHAAADTMLWSSHLKVPFAAESLRPILCPAATRATTAATECHIK